MKISDEKLIELAEKTCMISKTSSDLGFLVMFTLDDLKNFYKLLEDKKFI